MSNPERILAQIRRRPTELSFADLCVLTDFLGWTRRAGKGSHWMLKAPSGRKYSVPVHRNRVKQIYLDQILKEIDRDEGA